MPYQGSKHKLSKTICELITEHKEDYQTVYYEPFCGSGAVISKVQGFDTRIASDGNKDLICLWQALQRGWTPPPSVTREEYEAYRQTPEAMSPELRCYIGTFCSFAGKRWAGYASNGKGTGTQKTESTYRSLLKTFEGLKNVWFIHADYSLMNPQNSFIYCDPPYIGTQKYKGLADFDHDKFWNTVQRWSKNGNTILVSEITAPSTDNIRTVWSKPIKIGGLNDISRTEKLFLIESQKSDTVSQNLAEAGD